MKGRSYKTATAFRRALEDRLAAIARSEHVDLQRIRRQVAFDRLLARLFAEGNPPWILKGAYALELKLHAARTTKDIDLGIERPPVSEDPSRAADALLEILQSAAAGDLGDFFVFNIGEPTMDLEAAPYGGTRHPVDSLLDGRTFARFHLDVAVGDVCSGSHLRLSNRATGLDLPGFPRRPSRRSRERNISLRNSTLPREGQPNSRVKDLIDLVLLMDTGSLDPGRLRNAIRETFERRATHEPPNHVEPPPEFWRPVFR